MSPTLLLTLAIALCGTGSMLATPVEIIPPELSGAAQPQVAVSPEGHIHVTFGKGNAIYHTASLDDGRTFSKPTLVAELPKLALGMRRGPRIVATDRILAITAISSDDGNLHTWVSVDAGATWRKSTNINDAEKSAREGLHTMVGDGKGNVFVAWLDLRNGGTELWGSTSRDGGGSWTKNALIYKSPNGHICECCHPSAAMDGKGHVAVMWRNWLGGSRDMYAAVSSDNGQTFGEAKKLGSGTWKLNGCPMDGGAIAFDASGKMLATWRREKTIFGSELAGAEMRIADSAMQPIVVSGKTGASYLWESSGDLMLKKGNAIPAHFAETASYPAAAALPKGGAAVVWESKAKDKNTLLAEVIE